MPEAVYNRSPLDTRYKNTTLRKTVHPTTGKDVLAYDLWEPPPEVVASQATTSKRPARDAGRLDYMAYLVFDNPRMWWTIAFLNNIIDQVEEIAPGDQLAMPRRNLVDSLARR